MRRMRRSRVPVHLLGMLSEDVGHLSAQEAPMVGKGAVRPWLEALGYLARVVPPGGAA